MEVLMINPMTFMAGIRILLEETKGQFLSYLLFLRYQATQIQQKVNTISCSIFSRRTIGSSFSRRTSLICAAL